MKQLRIQLPAPHSGQRQVLAESKRFNVLACGRRFGKTVLGIDRIVKSALLGFPCSWFGPSYKMQLESYRALQEVLAPVIVARNNSEYRLELRGGGSIVMFSLDGDVADSVRGRAFKTVIVDEAAMVSSLRQVWESVIRPTLADHRGDAWFLSTPRGMNDFKLFYDRGQDSEREDWASWQIPTASNPHIEPDEIEAARHDMTEASFNQEFLALFVNWEGAVFRRILESATADRQTGPEVGHEYVIGADWGRSNDYTVFTVIDMTSRSMVDIDRSNRVDYVVQRGRLQALAERWRPTTIIAESNSIGQPVIEQLQRDGLPVRPFNTTNASKAAIIEALALAFEQGSISILNDPVLLGELQSFAAEQLPGGMLRYSAPSGQHDDCVMSLALAWSTMRRQQYAFLDYMERALVTGSAEQRLVLGLPKPASDEERMRATQDRITGTGIRRVQTAVPADGKAPALTCPECGAACIAPAATGGYRCGACGHQFGDSTRRTNLAEITGNTRRTMGG